MVSFKKIFLSALFGGVIGGILGAMLTLKIFGDQAQEQADEDEEEDRDRGAPDMRREPVEHDYIPEIWILFKMGEFPFLPLFYF